jgi:tagatose 6-phosphate kinase
LTLLTVTLNPCIDKTFTVPDFSLGLVHRPSERTLSAGGKGINVARALRAFGADVIATGLLGGAAGQWILQALHQEQIPSDFLILDEESRTCIAVLDPLNNTITELNEAGPTLTSSQEQDFLRHLRELLPQCEAVIISGSLPPGASNDLYDRLIRMAQEEFGVRAALDTSGPALAAGAKASPFLLKPNLAELGAFDLEYDRWELAAEELRLCYRLPCVIVTNGAAGAVLSTSEGLWKATPPAVTVASPVGSGDSLMAGFIWARLMGYTEGESISIGVAAGAANAQAKAAAALTKDQVFGLLKDVSLQVMER